MYPEDFVSEFLGAQEKFADTYEPREDSFLMLEVLNGLDLRGMRVLDMGTGSGILAAYCARGGAEVTASDIDTETLEALKVTSHRLGIHVRPIASDLFSKINDRFDMVVFNPPYLPSEEIEDCTVDGGRQGTEIVDRFFQQLSEHLTKNGFGLLVLSSSNRPDELGKRHAGLDFETVRQRSMFFETLYVVKVRQIRDPV